MAIATADLNSKLHILSPQTADMYATGEVLQSFIPYSVDLDIQENIYSSLSVDLDIQANIYSSLSEYLDIQENIYVATTPSNLDIQVQIYDVLSSDLDVQENIFDYNSFDLDVQAVVQIPAQADLDIQIMIYESAEADLDIQVRMAGILSLPSILTLNLEVADTDDLYATGDVITQADLDIQVQIYDVLSSDLDTQEMVIVTQQTDLDIQENIFVTPNPDDLDIQVMTVTNPDPVDLDIQVKIGGISYLYSTVLLNNFTDNGDLYATGDVITQADLDIQAAIFNQQTTTDLDIQVVTQIPESADLDIQVLIWEANTTDLDIQVNIVEPSNSFDLDIQVKVVKPVAGPFFLIREPGVETHDYTDKVLSVGVIRRFLNKEFGISQVGNVSVVCENSDKAHSYMHADGDFYPSSRYIWTWAKFTCGWGAGLDQNIQAQFQGLVETLELTEKREANFVIVDVIKELLDGKLANATTFDAALVASTSLESLNPIHIVEYLINDVLGVQVFDFDAEAFVDGAEPTSFDQAYTDSSTVVVNDTTWPAGSSIIEMIQDALKLVQGWIYTGSDGRIKAKVFTNPAPTGSEKHFIGSETDSDRKIMNLRLHPSRRDIINYVTWTYGQAGSPYGPDYDATSIGQYGYRPLALTTGWEVNTNILDDVSNELTSRYSQPPDMITFSTSNLYGSGDGLDAEIGEVIKVTDDGIGLADAYFRIIEKRDDLLGRKTDIVAEEYVGT